MDDLDRRLLDVLQFEFPLVARPYATVGDRLGIGEDQVLARLERLREAGTLRRLGVSVNPARFSHVSTLVGARVDPGHLEAVAALVSGFDDVSHNYERDDAVNLWFTVTAPDRERIAQILATVREQPGVHEVLDLPAERRFKLDARFRAGGQA